MLIHSTLLPYKGQGAKLKAFHLKERVLAWAEAGVQVLDLHSSQQ